MQNKITRLQWLIQQVTALDDDLSRPWSDYPCLEWPHPNARYVGFKQHFRITAFRHVFGEIPAHHDLSSHCRRPLCFRPIHIRPRMNRMYWLQSTLATLTDDLSQLWSKYPCLIFPYPPGKAGYGFVNEGDGLVYAHRKSYEIAKGPVPEGLFVCHRCDTRICVRPVHLFAGSHTDNMRDAMEKDRTQFGEQHWNAKLNDAIAAEVKRRVSAGERQVAVGRSLGIDQGTISSIVLGRSWRRVEIAPLTPPSGHRAADTANIGPRNDIEDPLGLPGTAASQLTLGF